MSKLTAWLEKATGGAPIYPLIVLFGLSTTAELDKNAFGVLVPDIQEEFGLKLGGILAVIALVLLVSLVLQVPIASTSDRGNRVRLAWIGAVIWGVFGVLTGLAPTLLILGIARAGSGIGQSVVAPWKTMPPRGVVKTPMVAAAPGL